MISYRYLPIFPQETELNPIEPPPVAQVKEPEAEESAGAEEEAAGAPEPEIQPAQA